MFRIVILLVILMIIHHAETSSVKDQSFRRCQKSNNGQHVFFCGENSVVFNRLKGERCINGQVVQKVHQNRYLNQKKIIIEFRTCMNIVHVTSRKMLLFILLLLKLIIEQSLLWYVE